MAHTPGPWKISEFDGRHYISDANGKVVAEAILCDEQEDNALLLAASTELLEALEHAVNWGHGFKVHHDRHPEWLTEAEAAIAKTKGK